MKRAGIIGLGLWLPDEVRRNDEWPESFTRAFHEHREKRRRSDFTNVDRRDSTRPFEELFVRHALHYDDDPFKGAVERRIASPDDSVAECDARAARLAMKDANVRPEEIDLIVSSAVLPDLVSAPNAPAIQSLLGCRNAAGIGVESFCSSSISQLDLAASLVETGRARNVLCIVSHIVNRANPLEYPSSPIFGDASAAIVVGETDESGALLHVVRGGDGALSGAVGWQFVDTPNATWWRDAQGPVHPGTYDRDKMQELIRNCLRYPIETIGELCTTANVSIGAVGAIATVQPLRWWQAAIADGLGIAHERIPSTYPRYAHIGGAGVVANLLEARRLGLLKEGSLAILYAHGAGLTRYAALIRWSGSANQNS
jgi:3-oxoacyl-[acyl-carrier-protein] synthase-3